MIQENYQAKRNRLAKLGEKMARDYLVKKGYQFLSANYFKGGGEIDLVLSKNDVLVFVEVKTRQSERFGSGETAVTPFKKHKILCAIFHYLHQKRVQGKLWRLDVVAIQVDAFRQTAKIKHFSDILSS
jgi:putative endonuclease